jgi:hypothetical protein
MHRTTRCALAAAVLAAASFPVGATEYKLTIGSSHPPVLPWTLPLKTLIEPESNKRQGVRPNEH